MRMRETGIKIIFQLIPIVRVSIRFSVPSLFHASIQYRAPASAIRYGGVDRGSASMDINPDDIESISVLKGPNAAALYGSRAGMALS